MRQGRVLDASDASDRACGVITVEEATADSDFDNLYEWGEDGVPSASLTLSVADDSQEIDSPSRIGLFPIKK